LALTKEGIIQSWKLITAARFTILLLCVWTGGHVYLCCGHVSMLICEQLTVSQSMWTISLILKPSHHQLFDYWTCRRQWWLSVTRSILTRSIATRSTPRDQLNFFLYFVLWDKSIMGPTHVEVFWILLN